MESGELWSDPEMHVEPRQGSDKKKTPGAEPWDGKAVGPNLSHKSISHDPDISENIEYDDFFDDSE